MAAGFVSSLYVWHLCGYNDLNPQRPTVIFRRLLSIALFSLGALYSFHCFRFYLSPLKHIDFGTFIGFGDFSPVFAFKAMFFVLLLFFGPFFHLFLDLFLISRTLSDFFRRLAGLVLQNISNFSAETVKTIYLGPFFEELVYRSIICAALTIASFRLSVIMIYSSFLFSSSHLHFLIWHLLVEKDSLSRSVTLLLTQWSFSFLFGLLASYSFVVTGSFYVCVGIHVMCNAFGFPDFGWLSSNRKCYRSVLLFVHVLGVILSLGFYRREIYSSRFRSFHWTSLIQISRSSK